MKKIILLFFILLASAPVSASDNPQAFIQEPKAYYSSIMEGKKLIHSFTIENRGKATLQVRNVKARG
jgi:hypothetical protein